MLRGMFELVEDAVSKKVIIFKVLLKKFFEFFLYHLIFNLKATILFMPLLDHCYTKTQSGKKYSV